MVWRGDARGRLARSLVRLVEQVDAASPHRDTISDGTIGDVAHLARDSDHNIDSNGVVKALDITHDVRHGVDCDVIAEALIDSRDPRIAYIIWNKRIMSSTTAPWTWRRYSGANPHDKHIHVSVKRDNCDDDGNWQIGIDPIEAEKPLVRVAAPRPNLRQGSHSVDVERVQRLLNGHGTDLLVDSYFGIVTKRAVQEFQRTNGLFADGVVGPYTWGKLEDNNV